MEIIFEGKSKVNDVQKHLESILSDVLAKVGLPNGAEPMVENLTCRIVFKNGDDFKYLTIIREIDDEDVPEMFTYKAVFNDNGDLLRAVNNENESFYDIQTIRKLLNKEQIYEEIESGYSDDVLEIIDGFSTESDGRFLDSRLYKVKGMGTGLIRYYVDGKLVTESDVKPEFFEEVLGK